MAKSLTLFQLYEIVQPNLLRQTFRELFQCKTRTVFGGHSMYCNRKYGTKYQKFGLQWAMNDIGNPVINAQ